MDRFTIQYDEHGVQLHNNYIARIALGIVRFWSRRGTPLDYPEHVYGMICRDRKVLQIWEKKLKEEGLL